MMFDRTLHMIVPPAATVLIITVALTVALFILPAIVRVGCMIAGALANAILYILRPLLSMASSVDWVANSVQLWVGAFFFCFFTSRISEDHRIAAFIMLSVLLAISLRFVLWRRANYRPHFPKVLFDARYVAPVWQLIASQRRVFAVLGQIAGLRLLGRQLEWAASQVHHRRWRIFLESIFAFSLYTLPVRLFPNLDRLLEQTVPAAVKSYDLQWIVDSQWTGRSFQVLGVAYLYLFDWAITIVAVYFFVMLLSPLEPRNIFDNVNQALRDYVRRRQVFVFAGLFWQHGQKTGLPAYSARDEKKAPFFISMAQQIHGQTLALDESLRGGWQGCNSRVSMVYHPGPGAAKGERPFCFHYRRLGSSAFLVAVDIKEKRFSGSNAKSQAFFQQLSESAGYLVNIRDSLK